MKDEFGIPQVKILPAHTLVSYVRALLLCNIFADKLLQDILKILNSKNHELISYMHKASNKENNII